MSNDRSLKRMDVIAEEAAAWLVQLQGADGKTKADFAVWLKVSPEHVREFLGVATLWEEMPALAAEPSVEELIAMARADSNIVTLTDPEVPASTTPANTGRLRRKRWLWAAAAIAILIFGGLLTLLPPAEDPNLYTTAIGEQTSLQLPDGSLVTLNTQSTLRVDYSAEHRDIYLTSGEALFDVTKDPGRPFRVITERAVIRAVGTQFNVRNDSSDVTVTVIEGIVDVSATDVHDNSGTGPDLALPDFSTDEDRAAKPQPVRITVGQQARVQSQTGEVAVLDAVIEKAIAWQQRRLVFEFTPLADVIDEFNRYNDPPLVVDDPELAQLPIDGVFRSNDRESFLQFLSQMQLAESYTRADGTVVLRGTQRDQ